MGGQAGTEGDGETEAETQAERQRQKDRDRQTETAGQCCGVGDVTGVKYHWQPPPPGHLDVGQEWHEPPK